MANDTIIIKIFHLAAVVSFISRHRWPLINKPECWKKITDICHKVDAKLDVGRWCKSFRLNQLDGKPPSWIKKWRKEGIAITFLLSLFITNNNTGDKGMSTACCTRWLPIIVKLAKLAVRKRSDVTFNSWKLFFLLNFQCSFYYSKQIIDIKQERWWLFNWQKVIFL